MRVDRTQDKMVWATKSSSAPGKSEQPPATDVSLQLPSSSAEATLIELKPSSSAPESDDGGQKRASYDLSVLIGDAHSLFRFTMYNRVPPEPKVKKGKRKVEPSEKKEGQGSREDIEGKTKLLPKVQNDPQPGNLSVPIEYSDSNL